jgi:hypothetical protein
MMPTAASGGGPAPAAARAPRHGQRVIEAALALLGIDLLLVLVTGNGSLLAPLGGRPVALPGFLARAALVALLLLLRVAAPRGSARRGRLLLALLLLPTLAQFQFAGGRINGDGIMYYVYVRSLLKDGDVDLANEYAHYGLDSRGDLAVPTKTGLRRSIFSVGPAVVWTPFFLLGEGIARAQQALGAAADLSGYGPAHRNAVALGSLLYGFLAVLLIHELLRRHFAAGTALGAALLAWAATFLPWYMVQQPTMSHAASACAAALVVWLWERRRDGRGAWGCFLLGLSLGVAMCIRWQNGVLLLLPGVDLARRLWSERRVSAATSVGASCLLAGALIGAFPQMAAWKALYDMWLLPYPPHGTDFVRLDHPFTLQTFFSSRHGLLSWTPVFWACYLGFLPLLRRRTALALTLLPPLAIMSYVNVCSGDWWAGASFSNRRFDSLLPLLAFGLAAALDSLRRMLAARPGAALALLALPLVVWNLLLAEQVRRGLVPRDDTVAFPVLVGNAARILADAVGSPTTWPASWLFAWRHARPPSQYDLLVGRYLFYRQNNLGGHVELGAPGDEALLGEGWGPVETRDGVGSRALRGRARVFAPLDVPEDLELRVRAAASPAGELAVSVNGRDAGRVFVGEAWSEGRLRLPGALWRRELNEVALESTVAVRVDALVFTRLAGRTGG